MPAPDLAEFVPPTSMLALIGTCVSRLTDIVVITEAEPFDEPGPRIVFVNDAFIARSGYHRDEVIGRTPRLMQGPLTSEMELRRVGAALRRWECVRTELVNYTKDGTAFNVEMDIVPIANEAGWYTHWVSIQRDVTNRKRAEREAATRELQRVESIGTLALGIAHDFNNIIAAILGNVVLGRQDIHDGGSSLQALEQIDHAAGRARNLVQQILAYARRQPQAFLLQPIAPLIRSSADLLRATLPSGVALHVVLEARELNVFADAGQLNQVLLNLGTNAWHAMRGASGRIDIRLSEIVAPADGAAATGRQVLLEVQDDGAGMDAATLAQLFEPYFTTKAIGQGTGLGLSVVWGIVKAHGATIRVQSELGHGTTFSLVFPVQEPKVDKRDGGQAATRIEKPVGAQDGVQDGASDGAQDGPRGGAQAETQAETHADAPAETQAGVRTGVQAGAQPAGPSNASGALTRQPAAARQPLLQPLGADRLVLVVDDDEVVLLMLEGILKRAAYRVCAFSDPLLALAAVRATPASFDVVVTDLNMPSMSGLQLARELAALRADLPVVLGSGHVSEQLTAEACGAGAAAVYRKEDAVDQLPALLATALDALAGGRAAASRAG